MKVSNRKYNEAKVRALYDKLVVKRNKGQHHSFEIDVDGLKVVRRTEDLDRFSTYMEAIDGSTQEVIIILHKGPNSKDYDKYIFSFKKQKTPSAQPLNGLDFNSAVDKRVKDIMRENDYDKLKEEFAALTVDHQKKIEELSTLKEAHKELRQKKIDLTNLAAGEVAASAFSHLAKNPQLLGNIPGAQHVLGLLNLGNENTTQEQSQVDLSQNDEDFAPTGQATQAQPSQQQMGGFTEDPQIVPYLNVVLGARNDLSDEDFNYLFAIFQYLKAKRGMIRTTFDLLDIQKHSK